MGRSVTSNGIRIASAAELSSRRAIGKIGHRSQNVEANFRKWLGRSGVPAISRSIPAPLAIHPLRSLHKFPSNADV